MNIQQLFDLSGRTAFVSGGNSGIGEAIATALGLAGARLILAARRQEALDVSASRLKAQGIQVQCISCDLADVAATQIAAQKALE
jgi:NADP-dependent 3-hydroxy acid dehydrogenase YdfG